MSQKVKLRPKRFSSDIAHFVPLGEYFISYGGLGGGVEPFLQGEKVDFVQKIQWPYLKIEIKRLFLTMV